MEDDDFFPPLTLDDLPARAEDGSRPALAVAMALELDRLGYWEMAEEHVGAPLGNSIRAMVLCLAATGQLERVPDWCARPTCDLWEPSGDGDVSAEVLAALGGSRRLEPERL